MILLELASEAFWIESNRLTEPASHGRLFASRDKQPFPISLTVGEAYRCTRAPAPLINFSTSSFDAMEVSPGVVIANAPCAAP